MRGAWLEAWKTHTKVAAYGNVLGGGFHFLKLAVLSHSITSQGQAEVLPAQPRQGRDLSTLHYGGAISMEQIPGLY